MTVVANLVAKISADAKGFESGIGKVRTGLAGLGSAMARVGSIVAGVAGVGIGVGGGLAAFTAKIVESVDDMADLGRRVRLSGGDMFALKSAAEAGGIGIEQLVQSVGRAQVNAVKARDGNSKLAETFSTLGINAGEFVKLDTPAQMDALSEGFGKIEDPALRAAIAVALFGRTGQAILPILEDQKQGLKETRENMDRFGKLTADQEKNVDAFDTQMRFLKDSIGAIGRQIGTTLAGPMAKWLQWFNDLLPSAIQTAQITIGGIAEFFNNLQTGAPNIGALLYGGAKNLFSDAPSPDRYSAAIGNQIKQIFDVTKQEAAMQAASIFEGMFGGITPTVQSTSSVYRDQSGVFRSTAPSLSANIPDVRSDAEKESVPVLKQILEVQREGNRILIRGVPAVAQ